MNPADVFGLIVAMAGILGFTGIMNNTYRRRLEHKERIAALKAGGAASPDAVAEREATIEKLEHRIRVLERIATDKSNALAAQIEDLREPTN